MIKKIYHKIKFELQFNNTKYYTRFSDKLFKTIYEKILANKIRLIRPIDVSTDHPQFTLATFSGKKRFYQSIAALYSFCFWERNINIHYHDDGSLQQPEIDLLNKIFPGIKIFLKQDQTIKTRAYLSAKSLNNCIYLRDNFVFGVKLFDMVLEKKTDYLIHVDSDVLFFSKPTEILDIIKEGKLKGCFNFDTESDMYTFDQQAINKFVAKPLLHGFNSGLLLHNFDPDFFDFVNKVMEGQLDAITSWHLEQTLLAMYASHKGDFAGLPEKYDILSRYRNKGNKIVSEHYTHNTGYQMHKDFIYTMYPQYMASSN